MSRPSGNKSVLSCNLERYALTFIKMPFFAILKLISREANIIERSCSCPCVAASSGCCVLHCGQSPVTKYGSMASVTKQCLMNAGPSVSPTASYPVCRESNPLRPKRNSITPWDAFSLGAGLVPLAIWRRHFICVLGCYFCA